jgi:hypothetical protein
MKFEQLSVIFPAKPVSKAVGRVLDVGWLDWLDEAAEAVVGVESVVAVIDARLEDEEVVVEEEEEEEEEEEDEGLVVASSSPISNPRRWSASCFVSRVQALRLGGGRVS